MGDFTPIDVIGRRFSKGIRPHMESSAAENYEGNVTPYNGCVRAFIDDFTRDTQKTDRLPRPGDSWCY